MRTLKKSLSVALAGAMVAGVFIFPAAAASAPEDVVLTGATVWNSTTDVYEANVSGGTAVDLSITAAAYEMTTTPGTPTQYTDVTWSIAGTSSTATNTGVSIDAQTGAITITNNAVADTYTITATDKDTAATGSLLTFNPVKLVVTRNAAVPYSIEVQDATGTAVTSANATYNVPLSEAYTLVVTDQFGDAFDVDASTDYSYAVSTSTSSDVSLAASGNGLTATTTAVANADTYGFTIDVVDSATPANIVLTTTFSVVVDLGVVTVTFPNNPLNYYYDNTTLTDAELLAAITGTVQLNGVDVGSTSTIVITDYEYDAVHYDATDSAKMDDLVDALLDDMFNYDITDPAAPVLLGLNAGTYTVLVAVPADANNNYTGAIVTLTINVTNKMVVTVAKDTSATNASKVSFGTATEVATNEYTVAVTGTAKLSTSTEGDGTDSYWLGALFTLEKNGVLLVETDTVMYSTDDGTTWSSAITPATDGTFTVFVDLGSNAGTSGANIIKTLLLSTDGNIENTVKVTIDFTAYTVPTSSGGSSGGSSGSTSYKITLNTIGNGKVTSSASSVSKNGNVTLTLTPNSGEDLVSLVVNGSDVTSSVTDNGNGTYTYAIKGITSAVTVTATFTTNGTAAVDNTINKFTDISGHWAYSAIKYVYEAGLMNGTSNTTFTPNGITTRAELVTVLWRMAGSPTGNPTSNFTDSTDSWSMEAINWAAATGVTTGTTATTFSPKTLLTRQEVVTFFYRYAQYQGYTISGSNDLSAYGDKGSVSSFAQDAMQWAVANGIITSTSTTSKVLNPLGNCTRGEIATILQRFSTTNFVTDGSNTDADDAEA